MSGFRFPGEYVLLLELLELTMEKFSATHELDGLSLTEVRALADEIPNLEFLLQHSTQSLDQVAEIVVTTLPHYQDWEQARVNLEMLKKSYDETQY